MFIDYMTWGLAILSLVGVILNIKKRTECFVIWLFTNASWTVYDYHMTAYAQSALFFIYTCLAVYGLYEWRKKKK
jgi:nicotinamide riboside transporter PnuC